MPFPKYLNFVLQFCPPVEQEKGFAQNSLRSRIEAGKPFGVDKLSEAEKAEEALGVKEGYDSIVKQKDDIGKNINGWLVGSALGDRAFFQWQLVASLAAALAGIYGNSAEEAVYPLAKNDSTGQPLDGSKHNYAITFAPGKYPPVNAFWSVTMYDGKTRSRSSTTRWKSTLSTLPCCRTSSETRTVPSQSTSRRTLHQPTRRQTGCPLLMVLST